ncbi:MAG TPA: helix-turn-helix domain-containing protein [Gemmataceae bacterium]|jgi:excisionase family DNA binding protein
MPTTTVPPNPAPPALLLTPRAAAAALAVSPRTLWGLTAPRGPIPAVKIGRSVRYSAEALRAWIAAQQKGGQL